MNSIGKIKGGSPFGQVLYLSRGRIYKYLVVKYVCFNRLQKFLGTAQFTVPIHELAQPGYPLLKVHVLLIAPLIAPVCCHPVLGNMVHITGTDLNFQRSGTQAHYGSMQRLVPIGLGIGNVVIKRFGQRVP